MERACVYAQKQATCYSLSLALSLRPIAHWFPALGPPLSIALPVYYCLL